MEVRIKVSYLERLVMTKKQKKILMDESALIDLIRLELIEQTSFGQVYFLYIQGLQDELRAILRSVRVEEKEPKELAVMSHCLIMENVNIRTKSFLGIFFSSKKELMIENRLKYIFICMLQAALEGEKEQIEAIRLWCGIEKISLT